jgi:uncharacterized membrane protein/predicted DsbA family dithiol-disulfide isomerase
MAKHSRLLILVLAAVAFVASAAALYVHYQLIADPTYASFCDVSETVSCEAVYRSAYGTVLGVPVAAGGAIWSAFVFLLAGYGMRVPGSESAGRAAGYVFLASVIGLAAVFYYAYASFFVLQKTCLLCVAMYVAVAGIFFVSSAAAPSGLGVLKGLGNDVSGLVSSPPAAGLAALWLVGSLALVGLFPREPIGAETVAQAAPAPVETLDPTALTEWHKWLDSQPKQDAALPTDGVKVRVMKFNDYQCPACRMTYMAYHDIIAKYEASHPADFKFETRDFPLETECGFGGIHGSACEAAVAVRLAREKNKGPELEAWLFERQESMSRDLVKEGLEQIAQVTNFDEAYPKVLEQVRADARLGQQLGVQGTPTFYINGIRVGSLRPAYFDAAIAYLLSKG